MAFSAEPIEALPALRTEVERGNTNFFSIVWRLTRMELYKLSRRRYSQVVLIILFALVIVGTSIFAIFTSSRAHADPGDFAPRTCNQAAPGATSPGQTCTPVTYTQTQLEQFKTEALQGYARTLGLPGSIGAILSLWGFLGMLGILLLGPLVGTEYVLGTIRLLFTRGPSRVQCILGKLLAGLLYLAGVILLLTIVYVVLGMVFYAVSGQPYSYTFGFFQHPGSGNSLGTDLLVGLIVLGYWFMYSLLASFFGTLGRSTAAAIGGAFGWYMLETILGGVCNLLQNFVSSGFVHDLAVNLPNYFLGNNFSALLSNRSGSTGSLSDAHALLVVGIYFVLLVGGSLTLTLRRDVTN